MKLKASFYTLGCRLNQAESGIIAKNLEGVGYDIVKDISDANLCVIHTCTVTNQSDSKSRQAIRSIQRKNPDAKIAVIGCFSQMSSDQVVEIGGVDLVLGNQEKLNLHKYLPMLEGREEPLVATGAIDKTSFSIENNGQFAGTTRANLKIQDGCDFFCSYCIIPFARGRSRSREIEDIKREAVELAKAGFKEVILAGINIGTYKYQGQSFIDVVQMLNRVEGIERIRISSIEPETVGEEIFDLMKDPDHKLLPYLHLPIQAASNSILKSMRRHYTFEEYETFVAKAVKEVPNICIGSDVLVGFPGEDDALFEEGIENLKKLPLNYFHVFPYSERKGTKSAKMPGKNKGNIIARRAACLRELSDLKRIEYAENSVGTEVSILFEEQGGDTWLGYSENFIRVSVKSEENLKNQIRKVKIESNKGDQAYGVILK